jgi:hypothetical protein
LKGDNNTKFFHKIAMGEREREINQCLLYWMEIIPFLELNRFLNILHHFINYCLALDMGIPLRWMIPFGRLRRRLLQLKMQKSTKPFSEEEIKVALFQMEKTKQ